MSSLQYQQQPIGYGDYPTQHSVPTNNYNTVPARYARPDTGFGTNSTIVSGLQGMHDQANVLPEGGRAG